MKKNKEYKKVIGFPLIAVLVLLISMIAILFFKGFKSVDNPTDDFQSLNIEKTDLAQIEGMVDYLKNNPDDEGLLVLEKKECVHCIELAEPIIQTFTDRSNNVYDMARLNIDNGIPDELYELVSFETIAGSYDVLYVPAIYRLKYDSEQDILKGMAKRGVADEETLNEFMNEPFVDN